MSNIELKETLFGFKYGPVEVERLASDSKGQVVIRLRTEKQFLDVRVTKTGMVRVHDPVLDTVWKPEERK